MTVAAVSGVACRNIVVVARHSIVTASTPTVAIQHTMTSAAAEAALPGVSARSVTATTIAARTAAVAARAALPEVAAAAAGHVAIIARVATAVHRITPANRRIVRNPTALRQAPNRKTRA